MLVSLDIPFDLFVQQISVHTCSSGPTLHLVRRSYAHTHKRGPFVSCEKFRVLVDHVRRLAGLLNLLQIQALLLVVVRQESVDALGVVRVDGPDLDEVVLLDDSVGELQEAGRVRVQVGSFLLGKDSLVQLSNLDVFLGSAFVLPVALSGNDVAGDLVRGLLKFGATERRRGLGRRSGLVIRVGEVYGLAAGVGVDSHRAVVVVGRVELRHEGAVDGDLVNVGRLETMVLSVSVEERSPLKKGIGRELDSGYERAWGEGGLLDVSVVVFRVSVQLHVSDLLHRELRPWPNSWKGMSAVDSTKGQSAYR